MYTPELTTATKAIHLASLPTKTLLRHADKHPTTKDDASPVTIADFAAQAILISILRHHFPTDHFIAEESASVLRGDPGLAQNVWELLTTSLAGVDDGSTQGIGLPGSLQEMLDVISIGSQEDLGTEQKDGTEDADADAGRRTWFLDPVDGTATFMKNQQYAVSLALVVGSEQVVGVVAYPNLPYPWASSSSSSSSSSSTEPDTTTPDNYTIDETITDKTTYGTLLTAIKNHGATSHHILSPTRLSAPRPLRIPSHPLHSPPSTQAQHQTQQPESKQETGQPKTLIFTDSPTSPYISYPKHTLVQTTLLQHLQNSPQPDPQINLQVQDLWSMQVKYASLALGTSTAMIRIPHIPTFRPYAYDHAGGMLVYTEAGGIVTDLFGQEFDYSRGRKLRGNVGLVAAHPGLHGVLLGVARGVFEGA